MKISNGDVYAVNLKRLCCNLIEALMLLVKLACINLIANGSSTINIGFLWLRRLLPFSKRFVSIRRKTFFKCFYLILFN